MVGAEADLTDHGVDTVLALASGPANVMDLECFFEHRTDAHARIQRGKGILQHQLHPFAHCTKLALAARAERPVIDSNIPGRRTKQSDDEAGKRALSGARFPNYGEAGTAWYAEADAIYGTDRLAGIPGEQAFRDRKMLAHVLRNDDLFGEFGFNGMRVHRPPPLRNGRQLLSPV
jgi:hypothetical protein